MSDVAIRVENLSKRYRIGQRQPYRTFRETINRVVTSPLRVVRPVKQDLGDCEFMALDDVSFEVKRGEVIGIIGRNGAGKSTLLKILSRITEPTTGRVEIDGRVGSLLEVGTGFHPELTGRENVFLNGAILGMKRAEIAAKFDEIVTFAGVERFLDTPVKHYSSGMYMRLAFAIAANLEPEILIVDEVLAVGDGEFQRKCLGKMHDVSASGRTVLFVSHTMAAIEQLCSRVLLLRTGQVQASGPTIDIISQYLSDATTSANGVFDLRAHHARMAQYKPIIQKVVLSSDDGRPTTDFFSGDSLTVDLSVVPDSPIREPRAAVAIEDSFGRRLTTVASYFEHEALPDVTRQCVIRCHLPKLQLGPGRYLLSVSIGDKYRGLLDSVDCLGWFDVGWRNYFGNGETHSPAYGPILTPSRWECVPD